MANREVSRREFIGISAGAVAGAALAGSGMVTFLTREAGAVTSFTPYKVKLPVPPVVKPELDAETGVYRLSLWTNQNTTDKMHPKLPKVTVWGYNVAPEGGGYLGPTIEVQRKDASGNPYTTRVDFTNNLPGPHPYIPIAETAPDGSPFPGVDERGTGPRILTHLHGGFVSGDNDGNPYATQNEYGTDQTQTVTYPPHPRATTLWYHDHALGMTRLNVYAGLAGFFRMRDEYDTGSEANPIGIPGGTYEVPIVIQDKSFSERAALLQRPDSRPWIPEFFGNTPVVNGAVQPFLEVEPQDVPLHVPQRLAVALLQPRTGHRRQPGTALLPDRLRGRDVRCARAP